MTIAEQLKAAKADIIAAREHAATVAIQTSEATRIVRAEVDKALKEVADLRAEVAELTNGGPTL
jgi:hypothetical protein